MASGGAIEREYITDLMRQRDAERASAVHPSYMAIPILSLLASPSLNDGLGRRTSEDLIENEINRPDSPNEQEDSATNWYLE